jgi:hypothetical protein
MRASSLDVGNAKDDPLTEHLGGSRDRVESDTNVPRIQQPIQLRSAGPELLCHGLLGFLLLAHGAFQLPRQYPFNGDRLDFFSNAFLF